MGETHVSVHLVVYNICQSVIILFETLINICVEFAINTIERGKDHG